MNALNEQAAEATVTRAVARRWVNHGWRHDESSVMTRLRNECARDLGRRTRCLPLAGPAIMFVLILAGNFPGARWPIELALFGLMCLAAGLRIHLAGKLKTCAPGDAALLARSYGHAAAIQAFSWGGLCGVMLFSFGSTPLTLSALVATAGVVAAAQSMLTVEKGIWLRFSASLWLPLLALLLLSALEATPHAWLVLSLCAAYAVIATVHGLKLVSTYIDASLNRSRLEVAVAQFEHQRDELDAHRTQLQALSTHAHKLSHFDQLTQLGSRLHFQERLREAVLRHQRLSHPFVLLYLDLNGFTDVNDSLGHAAGDHLLQAVGRRLHATLRHDDFAARLGSDEFAILLVDISDIEAARMVRAIRETIAHPVDIGARTLRPTVSIGMAVCPDDGSSPLDLLKAAESAMHAAKTHCRLDYMRYSPSMSAAATQRMTIAQELRIALHSEQFELRYQPQIDAMNGAVVGVEALIRWQHPERGTIPPLEFIGVAEKCGLIDEIGAWVLRNACNQAVAWIQQGLKPVTMAVNISPLQLLDEGFVTLVKTILKDSGLPADILELEMTESAVQTHSDAGRTLAQLRSLGARISIDDFGTGYSSLMSLKSLRVDRVKIDRAFVADMLDSRRDTSLVGIIVDMAHILEATVVAEGVETAAQVESLRRLGCDCVQGHYFSPAIKAAHVAMLMARTATTPTDLS